jgi:hypothetical protein
VETTNYRTVRLPSNTEVPEFVEQEFGEFYRDMFARQTKAQDERAVFLEYAWDMAWCDPCAADPLNADELRKLGVYWIGGTGGAGGSKILPQQAQNVFVTRLHVSYDSKHFPEDLVFQETGDRQNYQGRYVIRHPYSGPVNCDASAYQQATRERQEREAQNLASLTGWNIDDIRARVPYLGDVRPEPGPDPWWKRIWQ